MSVVTAMSSMVGAPFNLVQELIRPRTNWIRSN